MKKNGLKMMILVGVVLVLAGTQAFAGHGRGKRKGGNRGKIARHAREDVDGRRRMHHRGEFDGDRGRMYRMHRMDFRDGRQGIGRRSGKDRGSQAMRRGEGRGSHAMRRGEGRGSRMMRRGEGRRSHAIRRGEGRGVGAGKSKLNGVRGHKSKGFRACRGCPKSMGKASDKGPMTKPGCPKSGGKNSGKGKRNGKVERRREQQAAYNGKSSRRRR